MNTIVDPPVTVRDQESSCRGDGQLPCEIGRPNRIARRHGQAMTECRSYVR